MAEWLFEAGIGEDRAALVEGGTILEALIVREGDPVRAGAILPARLAQRAAGSRFAIAAFDGGEALIDPVPPGLTEGAAVLIEITRPALPERGNAKRARARIAAPGSAPRPAPDLRTLIAQAGVPVAELDAHGPDRLDAAGWSELIEEAADGVVPFAGGALRIALTPAMTLIDVDGSLPVDALAVAGAAAAGRAIRRHGIGGSIGIDLPTPGSKAARVAAAEALDAVLPQPFERTAVNGFGFLQIVRPRRRASLPELLAADPVLAAALALLRRAGRDGGKGARTLVAAPAVIRRIEAAPDWLSRLSARLGAAVGLRGDPALAISAGHVESQHY